MERYNNALIYKICCNDINIKDLYIGSTCNFSRRKCGHKFNCNNLNSKKYNLYLYEFIRNNGGWNNWSMIEICKYPCNNKRELETEERKYIEQLKATLNKNTPTQNINEWRNKNIDKLYRINNIEKIKEREQKKITCTICDKNISYKNFSRHFKKH